MVADPDRGRIALPDRFETLLVASGGLSLALLIHTFRCYRTPSVDPKSGPTP